jgi:hypothetical protein
MDPDAETSRDGFHLMPMLLILYFFDPDGMLTDDWS